MEEQNNLIETTVKTKVVRKTKKDKEKPVLVIQETDDIDVQNTDGLKYLQSIQPNSIDLILTDPPYIISKDSGMNQHYDNVKFNEEHNIEFVKTEEEWETYKSENVIDDDQNKEKYMNNYSDFEVIFPNAIIDKIHLVDNLGIVENIGVWKKITNI